jgi:miniconductance mechanosensitive channel
MVGVVKDGAAVWLLAKIRLVLDALGFGKTELVDEVVYVVVVIVASMLIGRGVKWLFLWIVRKVVEVRNGNLGQELLRQNILPKCAHIVPPVVFLALIPVAFDDGSRLLAMFERLVWLYALAAVGIGAAAVLTFVFNRYNEHANTRNLPLKGILNIAKGAMWLILVVVGVSIVADKSPAALLTGLGAFAAALLLIFKDSILGFIAGLQMSQNDMLHVGDWICVPSTDANGIVIDVSLSAVKVQNFDYTIVTVPPYTLVSTSFKNYRGMYDSGVRMIEETISVNAQSVCQADAGFVAKVCERYPLLREAVELADASRDTNIGLFRTYAMAYLRARNDIAKSERLRVYFNGMKAEGMSIMIYCYATKTGWNEFEPIRSEVMEHLCVAAADFGLRIYTENDLDVKMR